MNAKRLAVTLFFTAISETINKLFPLLIIRHAHQALGLEAFGYAAYGIYLVDIALPLVGFGYLLKGSLRASDKASPSHRGELIGKFVAIRLLHAAAVSIVAATIVLAHPQLQPYAPLVGILSFVWFVNAIELSFLYYAEQRLAQLSYYNIVVKAVSLSAVLVFVQDPDDKILYALLTYGTNAIVPLLTFVSGFRRFGLSLPKGSELWPFFVAALPYGIAVFLSGWYDRMDMFLVENQLSAETLGLYAGATKVYQSLLPLMFVLNSVFFSEILGAKNNLAAFQKLLRMSFQANFLVVLPMAAGVWFVDSHLLALLIGKTFATLGPVFSVLVVGLVFHALVSVVSQQILSAQEKMGQVACGFLTALAVAVPTGYFLTSEFGALGAALAVVLAKVVASLIFVVFAWRYIPREVPGDIVRILPATLLMLAFLWITSPYLHWLLLLAIAALLYIGVSLFTQRELVRMLWQKLLSRQPKS